MKNFFFLFEKRITIKIYDAIKAEKNYLQSSICFNFKTFAKAFFQVLHDITTVQHCAIVSVKNALIGS